MCGRYSFSTSREKLIQQFGELEIEGDLSLNYNVAPTQPAYVITNEAPHLLQLFHWGLLPYWSKGGKLSGRMINARREGIEQKPAFRVPLRRRRCWVPADSFYEWRREGTRKIPYRIRPKNGELLVLAGIWDEWKRGGEIIHSFSIITGPPNREVRPLHDRMPAILATPEQRERWLLAEQLEEILDQLKVAEDGYLELYQVPQLVNSVYNNGPELHELVGDGPSEQ
jgi:putative SOS response-associated peptidase YedK